MKRNIKLCMFTVLTLVMVTTNSEAQSKKEVLKTAEIGKCFIQADSLTIQNVKVADLIKWVEHPPFMVGCEDKKMYSLKTYEFTFLTLKPFMNQSYGVGDDKMIPILARKAMDNLKPGDTVILKNVVMTDRDGKDSTVQTLSLKINE